MFKFYRFIAVMRKDWKLIIGDKAILTMSVFIPLMQVLLFSYAINTNPKNLPTALINMDQSEISRAYVAAIEQTGYFHFKPVSSYQAASDDLMRGYLQFVIMIPPNLSKDMKAGRVPQVVIEADATDPIATNGALLAIEGVHRAMFQKSIERVELIKHAKFNPMGIGNHYIVPGLIGVILLFTLCMLTAVSIVKERVMGSMEILLTLPVELMLGKVLPYILIGYVQVLLILLLAYFQLGVPFEGSLFILLMACFPYILANLLMGVFFSTIAVSELQAIIATTFFMLPSILLSGFVFPFRGMPFWAQWIGNLLPLTHFSFICKGVMLKGINGFQVLYHSLPIFVFIAVLLFFSVKSFKKTLD